MLILYLIQALSVYTMISMAAWPKAAKAGIPAVAVALCQCQSFFKVLIGLFVFPKRNVGGQKSSIFHIPFLVKVTNSFSRKGHFARAIKFVKIATFSLFGGKQLKWIRLD